MAFRLILKQPGGGHVDAGAGILDHDNTEAGIAKISRRIRAADVCRQSAHHDRRDAAGAIERPQTRMLRGDGVRLKIAVETLAPQRMKSLAVRIVMIVKLEIIQSRRR